MPKIPDNLKAQPKKPPCIACKGTGKSSKGGVCHPCAGKGVLYRWDCPKCNARHDGIELAVCRNPKCPSNKRSK